MAIILGRVEAPNKKAPDAEGRNQIIRHSEGDSKAEFPQRPPLRNHADGKEGEVKEKVKVGETLYALNVGNAARRQPQVVKPVVVKMVGRKYFVVGNPNSPASWSDSTHHIETWAEKTNYTADVALYSDPIIWENEKEARVISTEIWKAFEHGGNRKNLSIESLRKIHALIKESK